MKFSKSLPVFIFLIIIFFSKCDTTEPPYNRKLNLKFEDASCTEAWILLTTENFELPVDINLIKTDPDGNPKSQILNLKSKDSLLYIDSLLPNKTYTIQILIHSIDQPDLSSNELSITTMDTTSHNFTWETFTFGDDVGSSILYDVAILNENSIWVVGEIEIRDSILNETVLYNAAQWNGNNWALYRIMFYTICGQQHQNAYPASSIIALSKNEIWIAQKGDQIAKIENGIQTETICMPWTFSINKIWGTSSNDLYVVGNTGNIARYYNGKWTKIESGTMLGLADIYGNDNGDLYCSGGNLSTGEGVILKINNDNSVKKIIDSYYYGAGFDSTKMFRDNLYGPLTSIWVNSNGTLFAVGNLIYRLNHNFWNYATGIESNNLNAGPFSGRGFSWGIRGKENNDFIFVGEKNTIRHFNGVNAIQLGEPFSYTSEYHWYSVDYKQNLSVAVGRKGGYASVIVLKK